MDVAMLIILAICTRLVAGIMNVEKMDAYTGSGEGFCKDPSLFVPAIVGDGEAET